MQYKTLALAASLASSVLAVPWDYSLDASVKVELFKEGEYHSSDTVFAERDLPDTKPVYGTGEFSKINIKVGKAVAKQDLRCQALDGDMKPIVATRGANVDITFSDAGKNEWTFVKPSYVSKVTCSPYLLQATPADKEVSVQLGGPGDEATQETIPDPSMHAQESRELGGGRKVDTIEILLPPILAGSKPDLRCAAVDKNNNQFTAKRGDNIDVTFSDADKGAWKFINPDTKLEEPAQVFKIICDPTFKSRNA